jgi:hypothetical protein
VRSFLHRHGAAGALAILSGAILGLPHLRPEADHAYQQADEWRYAVNTEAVRTGDWSYAEVYLHEHRDAPWPYPRLEGWITGVMAAAAGGTDRLYVLSDFLLPPPIFLGIYLVLVRLGLPRVVALLGTSLYVLHHTDLYYLIEHAWRRDLYPLLMWYLLPAANDSILGTGAHTFSRFPHPLLPRLVEAGLALALFPALRGRRTAIAAAGALLAVVTTLRFHDWMVLYPALALAAAVSALRRRPEARPLAAVIAIGLVLSLPALAQGLGSAGDDPSLLHRGLQRTRRLLPVELGFLYPAGPLCLLALAGTALALRARTPGRLAFAALTAGVVWGCGFQVLTGWTVVAGHWYLQHVLPIVTAAAGIGAGLLLRRCAGRWTVAAAVLLSFAHAGLLYGRYRVERSGYQDELREALGRVEPGAVVCSFYPFEIKTAAPHLYTFLTNATFSPVATEELLERYLTARKLYGAGRAEIEALFRPGWHQHLGRLVAGDQFFRYSPFGEPPTVQNTLPPEWAPRWLAFYDALPDEPAALAAAVRRRFKLDYLLAVPGEPAPPDRWETVYRGSKVALYRLPLPAQP